MKNKIEKVVNYMSNNTLLVSIFVLQFAFIFTLIYYLSNSYIEFNDKNNKIKNSLENTELHYIQNNEQYPIKLTKKNNTNDYLKFYDFLNQNFKILNCTNNTVSISSENLSDEIKKHSLTNMKIDNNIFSLFNGYWINNNFIDHFKLKTSEGRFFNKNEFSIGDSSQCVPVVLGDFFKSYFKIGDEIQYKDYTYNGIIRNLKVIGFLEKDQYILNKPVMFTNAESLNKSILFPNTPLDSNYINNNLNNIQNINLINTITYKNITESFLILNNSSDIDHIKNTSLSMNFFDITLVSTNDCISKFKKYYYSSEKINVTLLFILLISVIIVCLNSIIVSINNRKKEFGIYYALGAEPKYIYALILIELSLYFIIGGILSVIFLAIFKKIGYIGGFNLKIYILTWLYIILLISITSLLLYIKIKNIEIYSWLKEEK